MEVSCDVIVTYTAIKLERLDSSKSLHGGHERCVDVLMCLGLARGVGIGLLMVNLV